MELTLEQFDKIGPLHTNDLPINDDNQGDMLRLFNLLPENIQTIAINNTCQDSVFRDKMFEFVCEEIFKVSVDMFYMIGLHKYPKSRIDNIRIANCPIVKKQRTILVEVVVPDDYKDVCDELVFADFKEDPKVWDFRLSDIVQESETCGIGDRRSL